MAVSRKKTTKKPGGTAKKSHEKKVSYVKRRKRKIQKLPSHVFKKHEENPIILPQSDNGWEAWQTFNPGAIFLEDKVHFLYRAIGHDGISRFGYAASNDGFIVDERLPYPVYEHRLTKPVFNYYSFASGGSFGGAEDPRIVRVDKENTLYMTYTACDEGLRVALTSIKVQDFLEKRWEWKSSKLISPPGEIHKNWVIFPEKINGKYAILTSINPEISIEYLDDLEFKNDRCIESDFTGSCRKNCWDTCVRGAGSPPIKTNYGWLLFYHAIDELDPGKYKVGVMLLDLSDPTKILHRSKEPILEPEEVYENDGFKTGVVYASGAVVKNGEILIYYGAADSYVGVAYANFEKFLEELMKEVKPKLERKVLKKK
ncbi:glycosidase [Candidatus Peregrinibacteria bacterium]|nr:glycosidase [Candidatus Peregrinibacteria bacterium]